MKNITSFLNLKRHSQKMRQHLRMLFIRYFYSKIYNRLNEDKFPFLISFFLWKIIDIYRFIRDKHIIKPHIYGIYGYFGLWGQGKTISLTKELYELRQKYGDKIYIFTNYCFLLEDRPFDNWKMLLDDYDKPAVFAWDEVQNEFNSREYKTFPTELLTILTQNRKGNGKRIYYTAQRYSRVDKVFRELTYYCFECKTIFGRLTSCAGYYCEDYEHLLSTPNVDFKIKIKPWKRKIYIQTDKIRNLYDSFKMLHTAKTKEYLSREEINNLK